MAWRKKSGSAYYDSQASAAGALKMDVSLIRDAKRAGSGAFRSGRVHKADLNAWFEKHPPKIQTAVPSADDKKDDPPKSRWDRERAKVDYERALHLLEVDKRKTVDRDKFSLQSGSCFPGL